MLHKSIQRSSAIFCRKTTPGETIETKISRITQNNEPIRDSAEMIYTNRSDGVLPGTDIRTDRFDIAIEAMDSITKSYVAKREYNATSRTDDISKSVDLTKTDGTELQQNAS